MAVRFNSQTSRAAAKLTGLSNALAFLQSIGPNRVKAALKTAARKVSPIAVAAARQKAPQLRKFVYTQDGKMPVYGASGQLRKSIGYRIGVNKRTGSVYSVVGPRRRMYAMAFMAYYKPTKTAQAQRNVMVRVNPGKYTHLVENGFTAKIWGTGKRVVVQGKPFLQRALNEVNPQIEPITVDAVMRELQK
jgi:hypothetical protein